MVSLNIQKVSEDADRSLQVFTEVDQLADRIRDRAFTLFNLRGRGQGHAMDDWLSAEREICWPAAELSETDGEYELEVALAGFAPGEVEITATPSTLIIKAGHESSKTKKGKRKPGEVRWSEFRSEDVYRCVGLPAAVDVDQVTAQFENGLLKIMAPKVKEKKTASKKIKISTAA